jgi:hypothetical protein
MTDNDLAPEPAPEDDAAKWDRLSQFIVSHSQYGELPNAQEIIAKAITLGLAAPADRVVCAVTDGLVTAILEAAKPNPIYTYTVDTPRERVRAVLAAHWTTPAGADTEREWVGVTHTDEYGRSLDESVAVTLTRAEWWLIQNQLRNMADEWDRTKDQALAQKCRSAADKIYQQFYVPEGEK